MLKSLAEFGKNFAFPLIFVGLIGGIGVGAQELGWFSSSPSIQVYHAPDLITRRANDFTFNVVGRVAPHVKQVKYRLNDGPWSQVGQGGARLPEDMFNVELYDGDMIPGANQLILETFPNGRGGEKVSLQFRYDPSPIELPLWVDWKTTKLDVQDGYWESFASNEEWRVRPKPGFEGYDRILAVTGAFPQGRRVEADMIFRGYSDGNRPYGFGIIPLWGGHSDKENVRPRRGWSYGIAWYYSRDRGVGMEFSYKNGNAAPLQWVNTYRPLDPIPGQRYHITVEAWPEYDHEGQHRRYRQRMKWHAEGEVVPHDWMEIRDIEGSPLPEAEYAVALVAHRAQVDFGPVVVTSLEIPTLN
jgi:hypothetical protein